MLSDKPITGTFGWHRLMTSETNAAKFFYSELFGWDIEEVEIREAVKYTLFKSGDKLIGGMLKTPPEYEDNVLPHWMSFITVNDIDASIEKATDLGGTLYDAVRINNAIGRTAVIIDPSGAYVGLFEPK